MLGIPTTQWVVLGDQSQEGVKQAICEEESRFAMNEEEFWRGASPDGRARYRDATIIGQGAYSVVARATDTATGTTVAIKRISEVFYDAHEAKKVLREIRLLRDFRHPHAH